MVMVEPSSFFHTDVPAGIWQEAAASCSAFGADVWALFDCAECLALATAWCEKPTVANSSITPKHNVLFMFPLSFQMRPPVQMPDCMSGAIVGTKESRHLAAH